MENKSEARVYDSDYEGSIYEMLRYRWSYDGIIMGLVRAL